MEMPYLAIGHLCLSRQLIPKYVLVYSFFFVFQCLWGVLKFSIKPAPFWSICFLFPLCRMVCNQPGPLGPRIWVFQGISQFRRVDISAFVFINLRKQVLKEYRHVLRIKETVRSCIGFFDDLKSQLFPIMLSDNLCTCFLDQTVNGLTIVGNGHVVIFVSADFDDRCLIQINRMFSF